MTFEQQSDDTQSDTGERSHVVYPGNSESGLESLKRFFGQVPSDTGRVFIARQGLRNYTIPMTDGTSGSESAWILSHSQAHTEGRVMLMAFVLQRGYAARTACYIA